MQNRDFVSLKMSKNYLAKPLFFHTSGHDEFLFHVLHLKKNSDQVIKNSAILCLDHSPAFGTGLNVAKNRPIWFVVDACSTIGRKCHAFRSSNHIQLSFSHALFIINVVWRIDRPIVYIDDISRIDSTNMCMYKY